MDSLRIELKSIKLEQTNVFFVLPGSTFESNIHQLKLLYSEIDLCIQDSANFDDQLRKMTAVIKSIYSDSTQDFLNINYPILRSLHMFIESLLKLIALDRSSIQNQIKRLVEICNQIYNDHFAQFLNHSFWQNLRLYEWLLKEDMVRTSKDLLGRNFSFTQEEEERFFEDSELEHFFNTHRKKIIFDLKLIDLDPFSGKFLMANPLSDLNLRVVFDLYQSNRKLNEIEVKKINN